MPGRPPGRNVCCAWFVAPPGVTLSRLAEIAVRLVAKPRCDERADEGRDGSGLLGRFRLQDRPLVVAESVTVGAGRCLLLARFRVFGDLDEDAIVAFRAGQEILLGSFGHRMPPRPCKQPACRS